MNKSNIKYRDIDEYHASQPEEFREMLEQIREAIKQAAPMATEIISYGMPAFRLNKVLVYYALNKMNIGFYPTPNPIIAFKKELEKYNTSKGAIQFPIDKPLPLSLIKEIVKFRLEEETRSVSDKIESGIVHEVTDDIQEALKKDSSYIEIWNSLTPIQRNEWICWVTIVKKPETRVAHIHLLIEELKDGKRQPCCWPGCPHRRTQKPII